MINLDKIPRDEYGRPRVFLEEKCPVQELSIECQRERGASSALPPLYFLHIWWARRPLTISRTSIIGSLLPANYDEKHFLRLMGIVGDPISDKKRIDEANKSGKKLDIGFKYKRGFQNNILPSDLIKMRDAIDKTFENNNITILDSFAGGGSIPFESVRMGFSTIINELNPVASIIERATIEYPSTFGKELIEEILNCGKEIEKKIFQRLINCFPKKPNEEIFAYIWVKSIKCPNCELKIPLAPNFWLDKKNNIGYCPTIPKINEENECIFKINKKSGEFDPDKGTIQRGLASCPRCSITIESEYIKKEARMGKMEHQLAAIGFKLKNKKGRFFRPPDNNDYIGIDFANQLFNQNSLHWESINLIPKENYPTDTTEQRPISYGMPLWCDFFSKRQLLVHLITLEEILNYPWKKIKDEKKREALRVYMQFAFDKGIDYNVSLNTYHPSRVVVAHIFSKHDFAFTWSYAEIDGAGKLFRFGYEQIADAYKGIVELLKKNNTKKYSFLTKDASNLPLEDKSIDLISIDPPYYDNVMYAELSNYFYVWMKRGIGDLFPELFTTDLTDSDSETVANAAKFKNIGRGNAKKLAYQDYEAKMTSAFSECYRLLQNNGVLTIMFTHKKVEAWDTLAKSLLNTGFEITAAWPIHTESEHSLHQAKKNAASSTILLVCRKRPENIESAWWEDIKENLDKHVKEKAIEFEDKGLRGQDTFIACFGPALQILSRNWPVKTKDGKVISPQEALDRARRVVGDWFIEKITFGKATEMDKTTRFYILAWHIYKAREVKFDEINRLAISIGVDIDKLKQSKLLEKKGEYIRFLKPVERFRARALKSDAESYKWDIDYVHASIHSYEIGKTVEVNRFHQRTGAIKRGGYLDSIAYLLDVLPKTEEVTEYHTLHNLTTASLQNEIKQRREENFSKNSYSIHQASIKDYK